MRLLSIDCRLKKHHFAALLWAGASAAFIVYHLWGPTLVADAYHQRSLAFLNKALSGRADHSLAHYLETANRMLYTGLLIVLIASLVPFLVTYIIRSRQDLPRQYRSTELSVPVASAAFGLVLFTSLIPFSFVTYPPLNDYPFHIARSFILNSWNDVPALQNLYDIQSFILPNMGMDFSLLLLGKLLPIQSAGRVFLALVFGLILSGCLYLHKTIHGRLSIWPLASSFFLFNGILLFGFINYLFGIGLLLWAVALWIRAVPLAIPLRVLVGTLLSTSLFFAHLVSVGLFAIVVAGYELQRSITTLRTEKAKAVTDLAAGASIFVVPALLFLMSPTSGEANSRIFYSDPYLWSKFSALETLLSGYTSLNALQLFLLAVALVVVIAHGQLKVARSLYLPLAMLVGTYFIMPRQALSASLIDYRVPIALAFFVIAVSDLEFKNKFWHRTAWGGMVGFLLLRSLMVSSTWIEDAEVIHEYTDAYEAMPSNSILFVSSGQSLADLIPRLGTETPANHLGSLAMIERGVFVPAIFAHPSQQPISVKNRFKAIKDFQGNWATTIQTEQELATTVAKIRDLSRNECQRGKSIFLLLQDSAIATPAQATIVADGSRFRLLQIQSC
jgi:hypothetical protein